MSRLLNAYRNAPTLANRFKLQAYLKRHMMAACLASPDEIAFLRSNSFTL
jgi:hypothetical protein